MNRYTMPECFLAVVFCISLFSSCTNNDNETSQTYEYCVYPVDKFCADGPFTTCQENGRLSNTCPYPPSSSPSSIPSSSSKPSSSSSRPVSSSSVANVGGSCNISGYKTKRIGSQTWMAENLNCNVAGSVCWGKDPANCQKYGRLYKWETAMVACPSGWHLPNTDEWKKLIDFVGGQSTGGTKLKATSGWTLDGNGQDTYGFSALTGGFGYSDGSFYPEGDWPIDILGGICGEWWSATKSSKGCPQDFSMWSSREDVMWSENCEGDLYSVRCVQD